MKSDSLTTAPVYAGDRPGRDAILSGLLTKDTPTDYSGVYYMLQAFIAMAINVVLILFVDSSIAFPLCLALYAGIAVSEIRRGIYSPITIALVILYMGLYGLFLADSQYLPYYGIGIFACLAAVCIVLLILKRPLTTFYTREQGDIRFHYLISNIWLGAFLLSFGAAYALMPGTWYLVTPFCICFSACLLVVYLSFFDTVLVTRREKEFVLEGFTFKQIDLSSKEFEEYLDFYTTLLCTEVFETEEKIPALREAIRRYDKDVVAERILFGAYKDGKLVACMGAVVEDGDNAREIFLPYEDGLGISVEPLRRLGRLVELGRLGIAKDYRERTVVMEGLFKAMLEVALERDAVFLFGEVFPPRAMVYLRFGFTSLLPRSHPRYISVNDDMGKYLVLFANLAQIIFFSRQQEIKEKFGLFNNLNKLLAERWVKRMVVRHTFSAPGKRPWMHTVASIRHLLGVTAQK